MKAPPCYDEKPMQRSEFKVTEGRVLKRPIGKGLGVCLCLTVAAFLSGLALLKGCGNIHGEPPLGSPSHHVAGGFRNIDPNFRRPSSLTRWEFIFRRLWTSSMTPRSFEAPRVANDGALLRSGALNPSITWIGHSTLLIQMDGLNIVTDPQWSAQASPVSWAGPKRLSPPGLAFEDLPRIHAVVISHDHYDHLDLATVKRLAATHDPIFMVPLGMKAWFADNGMSRVEELDWWQEREYRGVKFVCLPAQHFAQRTLWDANTRLWASWAFMGRDGRLYFSGDTGYFAGFREIGGRIGPFDVAAVAIGAYLPPEIMKSVHMTPEEAVRAFEDLRSQVVLGMHWGTFDLAEEPLHEPPERMRAEIQRRGIRPERAWILKIGETHRW